jgi:hypothetical protein
LELLEPQVQLEEQEVQEQLVNSDQRVELDSLEIQVQQAHKVLQDLLVHKVTLDLLVLPAELVQREQVVLREQPVFKGLLDSLVPQDVLELLA